MKPGSLTNHGGTPLSPVEPRSASTQATLPSRLDLLQERDAAREAARWTDWREAREKLRESLHRHLPGHRVWLFGSVTQPGRFNAASDVDLALEELPADKSVETLTALIEEDLDRPVDVIRLSETRLRQKILETGELWIA